MKKEDLYLWAIVAHANHYPDVWNIRAVFKTKEEAEDKKSEYGEGYDYVHVVDLTALILEGDNESIYI